MECFGGSWAKARVVNSSQEEWGLICSVVVLLKRHKRKALGGGGTAYHEKSHQELTCRLLSRECVCVRG